MFGVKGIYVSLKRYIPIRGKVYTFRAVRGRQPLARLDPLLPGTKQKGESPDSPFLH